MELTQGPSPWARGSLEWLCGASLDHLGSWLWLRRGAVTQAAKVVSVGHMIHHDFGFARCALNPEAPWQFRRHHLAPHFSTKFQWATHDDAALCFAAAESLWATGRAGTGGVSRSAPSLSALTKWALAGGSPSSRGTRG